jgi:hypothetical protein
MSVSGSLQEAWRPGAEAAEPRPAEVIRLRPLRPARPWGARALTGDVLFLGAVTAVAPALGLAAAGFPDPGGQLVDGAARLAAVVLGYLLLRELGLSRALTVALPALLVPVLGTLGGGVPAPAGELGLALCALAIAADLRSLRPGRRSLWAWKPIALLAILGAGMASAPLVPILALGAALTLRRSRVGGAVSLLVLAGACWWIVTGMARDGLLAGFPDQALGTAGRLAATGLAGQVASALRQATSSGPAAGAAAIGGLWIGGHLWHVSGPASSATVRARTWLLLALAGAGVASAGGAVAAVTAGTGAGAAVVPGAGGAMLVLGCLGLVSSCLPSDLLRREVFSVLATLACAAGLAVSGTTAIAAAQVSARQHAVIQGLVQQLPKPPAASTLLVEQGCAEGALPAFRSPAALADMLAAAYRDRSIQGALLTRDVVITGDGLATTSAGSVPVVYPYGNLFVYNETRGDVYRLGDAGQAYRYFALDARSGQCSLPPGGGDA